MKSIREANVSGKRVLVRCDLDVPIQRSAVSCQLSAVVDDFRIRVCLPTLKYLIDKGAKVIICGHLGRPKGKVVPELRMNPVAEVLEGRFFAPPSGAQNDGSCKVDEVVGSLVSSRMKGMKEGEFLLLENLRFDPGEEANDPEFVKELAGLADIYVNECFAASHRNHASIVGVPKLLPAYGGLRLEEEISVLSKILQITQTDRHSSVPRDLGVSQNDKTRRNYKRPLVFVMGGAKTETKVPLVREIFKHADKVLLGGRLMFEKSLEDATNVVFPVDDVDGFDIGPKTVKLFKTELERAGTVVWNGPLGKFESADYADGTRKIAEFLSGIGRDVARNVSTNVIVGGGDTLAALKQFGLRDKTGFVSTGGGSMLAFLAGENLPGIEALG